MTRKYFIIAWATLVLLPVTGLRADDPVAGDVPPMPEPVDVADADETLYNVSEVDNLIDNPYLEFNDVPYSPVFAARIGGWGTSLDGSKVKVGEWQDVESSIFWSAEGLFSNGQRTIDFFADGNDNETTTMGLYGYFGEHLTADFEYDRFMHRLDHDPFANYPPFPATAGPNFMAEDLNVGEDYAIRVQEFRADFKGRITENVRWELNFWNMSKSGERQANAVAHCYDHPAIPGGARFCHVLSQRQQIDWSTSEIEPVLAAKFGSLSIKYSRPMRFLNTNDQAVFRSYNAFPPQLGSFVFPTDTFQYARVPENVTQTDRLQIGWEINEHNDLYVRGYHGNTHNKFRALDRNFYGYDARVTNRAIDGVTLEAHAKNSIQRNEFPPFIILGEPLAPGETTAYGTDMRHSINYDLERYGVKMSWRPYTHIGYGDRSLRITTGYDYRQMNRQYAHYETVAGPHVEINQDRTIMHDIFFRADQKFYNDINGFFRYRMRQTSDPLYGFRETNGDVNTGLPLHEDLFEIGGSWAPSNSFVADFRVGIEDRSHHSGIADFDECSVPVTATLWWAPYETVSFSAGYGYYSNGFDQFMALGDEYAEPPGPTLDPRIEEWAFDGKSHVLSIGANWAPNDLWRFVGSVQYTDSRNTTTSLDPTTPFPELPTFSNVVVRTTRFTAGVDYLILPQGSIYLRYNLFDYDDRSAATLGNFSGTLHSLSGGIAGTF